MKLILSLTLIWTLCSTAGALQCQNCTDSTCSTTVSVTCPTGMMCVTASIQATLNGNQQNQIFKSCALPSLCPSTGPQTFSANLLPASVLASAECCNTDDCNAPTQPAAPTTAAPTTVSTTTASSSDACCVKLGMIHLFLGLLIFTIY
ncbi:lymphocyte antigen 6B-like [Acanthochromis polyacanthus]|uniref:lymphocyte antigen 6B-like n=1 Tax=Acanthochromis polyacanthus TaxID=80966 RepID=UPI002234C04F|nr:lymphocyte antigen 6B-like [Acanthochromis polyacanthus]